MRTRRPSVNCRSFGYSTRWFSLVGGYPTLQQPPPADHSVNAPPPRTGWCPPITHLQLHLRFPVSTSPCSSVYVPYTHPSRSANNSVHVYRSGSGSSSSVVLLTSFLALFDSPRAKACTSQKAAISASFPPR
ncbi:hypothetical protein BDV93DRAFT_113101 [Ceratobasidium sp. AG-I]|nr:hypothetical protein BDV93DRAFT_113101 [Ceratobasidium sp. AG-I]